MNRRILIAVLLVLAMGAVVPTTLAVYRAQTGLGDGEELLAHGLWPQARQRFVSYLWLHPSDGHARMRLAEAFAKDESLPSDDAASQAIDCLDSLPDSSSLAAEARLQQGRLCFLILQKPARAEQYLRRSIALGGGLPALQLLWKLLNVTARPDESEDIFWRVYDLSTDDERPLRLSEWYLSQFFPGAANESLDRLMGALAPGEAPTRMTESRRYLRFREREPEASLSHVALAQWCQQERDPKFALRVLEAAKAIPSAQSDSFFLSVSVAAHLDLGQFQEAEASFRQWPEPGRGHDYWKWRAIICDEVLHQHQEALAAYDQALELWPGQADWRVHSRKVACLTGLKRPEEANAARLRAAAIKALMAGEVHERLRAALGSLDDPQKVSEVKEFYRKLGRSREVEAWDRHLRRLQDRTFVQP